MDKLEYNKKSIGNQVTVNNGWKGIIRGVKNDETFLIETDNGGNKEVNIHDV